MGHQPFCVTIIGSIFVSFVCFLENSNKTSNFKCLPIFFFFKNIVKRFYTTKNCSICKQWWPYRPA
ncbi:hypothetical protein F4T72_00045 [Acinetobacter pittii]|nr:hypothetical protein [Acinetobacter pittii]